MAERRGYSGPEFAVQQVPAVQFSTGAARNLEQTSALFSQVNALIQDDLDRTAKADGAKQGVIDASNGTLNEGLLYKPTIRGQAYTATAIDQYEKVQELKARNQIETLYAQNRTDPARLQKDLTAWRDGALQEMPESMRAPFALRFNILSQASVSRANENLTTLRKGQQEAEVMALDQQVGIDADRVAAGLFSGDQGMREASWAAMMQSRHEIDAAYSRTVKDANGADIPVFDPEKRAKALMAFDQRVTQAAVKGWFDSQSDKVRALQDFRAGKVKAVLAGPDGQAIEIDPVNGSAQHPWRLTADGIDKMANWMRTTVSAEVGLQNSLRQQQMQVEQDRDNAMLTNLLRVPDGNPAAVSAVVGVIEATTRDPRTIEAARKYKAEYGTGGGNDPVQTMAALADFADGKLNTTADILLLRGVDDATKRTLLNGLQSKQNAGFFMNTNDYKAAVDMVNTALGSELPPGTVITNPDAFMRAREAQRKALLNDLVTKGIEATRSGKPYDPVEIANKGLAKRGENARIVNELNQQLREIGNQQTELRQKQQGPSAGRLPPDEFSRQMNDLALRARGLQTQIDTLK